MNTLQQLQQWPIKPYPKNPPPPLQSEVDRLRLELSAARSTLSEYASLLADARQELREWRGKQLLTEPGCEQVVLTLDNRAQVTVEFRRTPAVLPTFDDRGEDEQIEICTVYVNKTWVDASEFSDSVLDRWIEAIKGRA